MVDNEVLDERQLERLARKILERNSSADVNSGRKEKKS
jgi:hypothetical protein